MREEGAMRNMQIRKEKIRKRKKWKKRRKRSRQRELERDKIYLSTIETKRKKKEIGRRRGVRERV